ncbi:AraC-like ligand binding domain-containing protein [Actinopolymorpha cephalotaxi]|uniref:AraC-like DNA-binding protein/mannose-6-phosphate isomerase-like protein (Cupin superfamily) n=1 Tax=Actinopolymorpha cephalotaxi TaxID=504797 RepID=A0A1I2Y318_9ACTN|nr:AraC family transcriptional regulator [Actinopolymorpha cephalotaxi]NYH87310.1 AraC-like DNA-binding protein/mannose-6-phosphate isomerase-like protein (cupin superfamily) [Actinopolymorpha cephalotaxi]SFH20120.1 AraC-like ligand binding domain-containing protein [Actinopolymorpha cephalotaxi]
MPSRQSLRFESHAVGRAYHAALVRLGPRSGGSDRHGHADFYELMTVVAGYADHHVGSGVQALEPGDVVLVRPRDQHAIAGRSPAGVTFVNVAFPAPAWRSFVDLAGADPDGTWEQRPEPPLLALRGERGEAGRAAFDRALAAFHRTPTMLDLIRFWSEILALGGFDGHLEAERGGAGALAGEPRPAWLVRACAEMRTEDNLRAGVPRLRELATVSGAHLARSMRTHYATSPTRFVTELRLERARVLLATTDLTVTAIAHRTGFASQSYFTRCFHRAHELSPRAYRRRARRAFVP